MKGLESLRREKEQASGNLNPRLRQGHGEEPGEMSVATFIAGVSKEVAERAPKSAL